MGERVYLGRDNAIDLVLVADGSAVALDPITRVLLVLGATTLDSSVAGFGAGQPFDATVQGTWNGQAVDVLRLTLGAQSVPKGTYAAARLIVYDNDHPNGLVWTEELEVRVQA